VNEKVVESLESVEWQSNSQGGAATNLKRVGRFSPGSYAVNFGMYSERNIEIGLFAKVIIKISGTPFYGR